MNAWAVGLDSIPEQWTALVSLRSLQLRGHTMLLVRRRPAVVAPASLICHVYVLQHCAADGMCSIMCHRGL